MRPQLLQRWWTDDAKHNGVSASLGCEGITLHQLCHSNISMMGAVHVALRSAAVREMVEHRASQDIRARRHG